MPAGCHTRGMFTGLIQDIGEIRNIRRGPQGAEIEVTTVLPPDRLRLGDSLATNGVCLTIVHTEEGRVRLQAVPETIDRTTVGKWKAGMKVNLEPALAAGEPMGGHIVQGHVDGTARVLKVLPRGMQWSYEFEASADLTQYMVEKGSVAIDGVSLTLTAAGPRTFSVAVIPHTREHTTLGLLRPGMSVNVETDIIGKYIARYIQAWHR